MMRKTHLTIIAAIIGILVVSSACGKKEHSSTLPNLSAPISSTDSPALLSPSQSVPAEIEVKASSGPVELSLALYKTKMEGVYPRFRVRLRNTGKNKIRVLSEAFTYPFVIQGNRRENTTGTYLEILNSAGKAPAFRRLGGDMPLDGHLPQPLLTEKDHAEIEAWEKQGIRGADLSAKVGELIGRNHSVDHEDPPAFWMEPGASTTTTAWVSHDRSDAFAGSPDQGLIGDFAQLSRYDLPPGKYRIRAIYDEYSDPEYFKKNHIRAEDWFVLVKTPYIDFEILQ
jgi:hypothetical protein